MGRSVARLHLRAGAFFGCAALVFLFGGNAHVFSADFSLPATINNARAEHAPSSLFFPCVMVDTTAGTRIKSDSEMTVYSSAIHPDIIYIPGGWNGHQYWASYSPYPHLVTGMGNENPHVACSDDGVHWTNQVGKKRKHSIKNPLIAVVAPTDLTIYPTRICS